MNQLYIGIFRQLAPLVVIGLACASSISAQKPKAEDIVAKHLESIGTIDDRKKIQNQTATGSVEYTALRRATGGSGRMVIASEGSKLLFGMTFTIPSYPAETVIFDGKNARIAFAISNARSELGDFLYRYKSDIVHEGLLGGTLSHAWPLTDLPGRRAKVSMNGSKKIDCKQTFVLSYLAKGGSDLEISLYIDQTTYEHVRTEYRRVISSIIGPSPDASAQQREQRQTMIEDFSDYRKENGLNLPHAYRAYIRMEGAAGVREYEYKAQFSDFFFNQPLDPNSFELR